MGQTVNLPEEITETELKANFEQYIHLTFKSRRTNETGLEDLYFWTLSRIGYCID